MPDQHYSGEENRRNYDDRLRAMEAEMRALLIRVGHMEKSVDEIDQQEKIERKETNEFRNEMRAALKRINDELVRYRGFIGGVMFIVAAMSAAATYFKVWIFAKLGLSTS